MTVDERVAADLKKTFAELRSQGELLPVEQLQRYYDRFREQFGPERLRSLDGRTLLYKMHALHEDHRDSLVYWLEFKDDEEFPTPIFGSIAGGSAHKYGLYQRKEDGVWIIGSAQKPVEISEDRAIEVASKHRDQLIGGYELLARLSDNAGPEAYEQLQADMTQAAPDIQDSAWAHKYFHLMFPDKLDDFHVAHYQQFHLIKLLIEPPSGDGRYVAADRFVGVAAELGWKMQHLTKVLNERDGRPRDYWRVLVQYPDQEQYSNVWPDMRDGGFIAISFNLLGDLSDIQHDQASKDKLKQKMVEAYNNKGWYNEIFNFVARMKEGDIVLAMERSTILGVGRVTGSYIYETTLSNSHHHRPVEWLSVEEWSLPEDRHKGRVVKELTYPADLIPIERHLLDPKTVPVAAPVGKSARLSGTPGRIQTILDRKKQVILYGPPGTGKTYWARIAAQELAARRSFGNSFALLPESAKKRVWADNPDSRPLVRICTFHPAYGYEDFLEGYRPVVSQDGQLAFQRQPGIFMRICDDARRDPQNNYYLIIDEINRGDVPRIFGELLTVLEKDKREQSIMLPLSGQPFSVPENVYVIGTMNTADRSIALLDTALRRRFGFIELMPDYSVLEDAVVGSMIPLGKWLEGLNSNIITHVGRDTRNLQIGHAYLLEKGRPVTDIDRFVRILQDDLVPLLEEYCYEDYDALSNVLGSAFVDKERQRVRHELFGTDRRDDLVVALAKQWPELIASADVVAAEAEAQLLDDESDDELTDSAS